VAQMTVKVVATQLEKVRNVFQVIRDVVDDERLPAAIREEIMDKVNSILESKDTE
jgi:uncharacterized protein (UPF0147 family)